MGKKRSGRRGRTTMIIDYLTASLYVGTQLEIKHSGLKIPTNRPYRIMKVICEHSSLKPCNVQMDLLQPGNSIIATSGPFVSCTTPSRKVLYNRNYLFNPVSTATGNVLIKLTIICDNAAQDKSSITAFNLRTFIQLGPEELNMSCPSMYREGVDVITTLPHRLICKDDEFVDLVSQREVVNNYTTEP